MNLVIDHINNHLGEQLNTDVLARIASFSPYHFHRIVKALLGETIGAYITRLRLEAAAGRLRHSADAVADIAYRVGYESASSLTKAFSATYGVSPTTYRNDKTINIMSTQKTATAVKLKKPKMVTLPDRQALYIRLVGEYGNPDYATAWPKLWAVVKEQKLFTKGIEHIGISYDNPNVTDGPKIRYDACLVIHKPAVPSGEVDVKTIAGGKFACFLHIGPYNELGATYDAIFSQWLPESGCDLREEACMEKYISIPGRVEEGKLKTEIYVPVK